MCDVRQRFPVSLLIFDLHINDILTGDKGIIIPGLVNRRLSVFLFADDLLIFDKTKKKLSVK